MLCWLLQQRLWSQVFCILWSADPKILWTLHLQRHQVWNKETIQHLPVNIFLFFFSLVLVVKKILHHHHHHLLLLHHQQHQQQQLKQRTTIIITIMTQQHLQHQMTITISEDDITIIVKNKLANSWYEEMTYWQFEFCKMVFTFVAFYNYDEF